MWASTHTRIRADLQDLLHDAACGRSLWPGRRTTWGTQRMIRPYLEITFEVDGTAGRLWLCAYRPGLSDVIVDVRVRGPRWTHALTRPFAEARAARLRDELQAACQARPPRTVEATRTRRAQPA